MIIYTKVQMPSTVTYILSQYVKLSFYLLSVCLLDIECGFTVFELSSCSSQCNGPTYVGNGIVCGLDSDYDGFPDVGLDCNLQPDCIAVCVEHIVLVNVTYIIQDNCPTIYSSITDRSTEQQDVSFCTESSNTVGMCVDALCTFSQCFYFLYV